MSNIEDSQVFKHKYKNVNIKFSAHDAFLEYPSSGTPKDKYLKDIYLRRYHTLQVKFDLLV